MNWSTRLRRWVRIRTPPVREASMKPTAATVLPAPVACSNQKRRLGAGVLGRLGDDLLVLGLGLLPVLGLLVGGEHVVVLVELGHRGAVAVRALGRRPRPFVPSSAVARRWRAAALAPGSSTLGDDRRPACPESASTWCVVELGAVAQLRRLVGEQALEPEQQREVAAPLDRGRLGAGVELGQGGVDRAAAGGARRQVGDLSPSSRIGSRANSRARSRSVSLSSPAALAATSVVLAMGRGMGPALAADPGRMRRAK